MAGGGGGGAQKRNFFLGKNFADPTIKEWKNKYPLRVKNFQKDTIQLSHIYMSFNT